MVKIGELGIGLKLESGSIDKITRDIQQQLNGEKAGDKLGKDIAKGLDQKKATSDLAKDIETKVGNAGDKAGDKLNKSLGGGLKALVGLGITKALNSAAGRAYTLAGNLEQADVAFTTMLGGAEASKRMLKDLSDFAAKTPFELTGIRQTAKQLLAYGIEAHKIIPTLKSLGDVSSGLSVPIEQVAYAYGQVRSAGRLLGQDLRQFTNAGVPIIQELSKNLGVAEADIKKMVSEGKIGFADVEKAFQTMSSEGGKFADMMDKQSGTMMGAYSNLKDAIDSLGETIGSLFVGNLAGLFNRLSSVIDKIKEWAAAHPTLTKAIVAFVGVGGILIGVITAIGGAVAIAGAALGTMALPILGIVAAVAALTAGSILLTSAIKEQEEIRKHQGKSYFDLQKEIENNKKATEDLNKAYEEGKITAGEYKEKLRQLQKENESLQKASARTTMSYEEIRDAIEGVNNSKLNNKEKLIRLLEIQQRANFTQKSIINLKKELASLSKTVNNIQELESGKFSWGSYKAYMNKSWKDLLSDLSFGKLETGNEWAQRMKNEQVVIQDQVDNYDELAESAINLQKQIDDLNKTMESGGGGGGGGGESGASKKAEKLKEVMDDLKKAYDEAKKADKAYEDSAKKTAEEVRKYYEKLGDEILGLRKKYQDLINDFEKQEQADKESFLRSQTEKAKALEESISKGKSALIDLKNEVQSNEKAKLSFGEAEDLFKMYDPSKKEAVKKELEELGKELEKATTTYDRDKLKEKQSILEKIKEQLTLEEGIKVVQSSITELRKKDKEAQEEAIKSLEKYKKSFQELKDKYAKAGAGEEFMKLFDINKSKDAEAMLKKAKAELEEAEDTRDKARLSMQVQILEQMNAQLLVQEQLESLTKSNKDVEEKIASEKKRAEMSPEERAVFDFEEGQKKKEAEFEAKKKKMEDEMKIYEFFQNAKFKSSEEVAKLITEENLRQYSLEEQELILKLARDRIQLEQQKEEKIKLEEAVHKRFNELSNATTGLQLTNLGKLKSEYKTLISQIDTAIAKQRALNAERRGGGFSIGGFTGMGADNEIAGVVHKNERVAPAWMTAQFADTFKDLEKVRVRGFQSGGFTSDNSRHIEQNNNITVQDVFDMEEFLDRQRRKLR